jgi:hypothetical protein
MCGSDGSELSWKPGAIQIDPALWSEDLIARYSRRGRTPVVLIDGRVRMVAAEDSRLAHPFPRVALGPGAPFCLPTEAAQTLRRIPG